MEKRLYKNTKDKMIAGVGSGLADYFKVDVTIVRIIMALILLSTEGFFLVAYIIAAIIIPEKPKDLVEEDDVVEVTDDEGRVVHKVGQNKQVLGYIFIGVGAMMLLAKTMWWFDSGMILALGVIGVGAYILFKKS